MDAGLSLNQAPPFSVPLRFYLTAPIFLALAGLLAAFQAWEWTGTRWSPATMALTHLVTLGYLGLIMLGSLAQMLPVVAGSPMPAVVGVARVSHALLVLGIAALIYGLAAQAAPALLIGSASIGLGLAIYLASAGLSLKRARPTDTVHPMRKAILALAATWVLGALLGLWLAGLWKTPAAEHLVSAHVALGLLGWITLLVMGVAYQVVPMLQITPPYPRWLSRWLGWVLAALLLAWLAGGALQWPLPWLRPLVVIGLAACPIAFALATLHLQSRRRRKLGDVTLNYWRLGMASLMAAALLGAVSLLLPEPISERWEVLLGLLFLLGFAASVVNGMLFKIVPFLAWFHLHAQVNIRRTPLGNMKDFLPDHRTRRQFWLHVTALGLLLPAPWLPWLAVPGGLLLTAAALMLEWNLWQAWRLFRAQGGNA